MPKHKARQHSLSLHDQVVDLYEAFIAEEQVTSTAEPYGSFGIEILDTLAFRKKYLRQELLSKFSGTGDVSANLRKSRAIDKWLATERRNERTNVRLYSKETYFGPEEISSDRILEVARCFVLKVLSNAVPENVQGDFTNGSSTSQRREPGSKARKLTEQAHVTSAAWPIVLQILQNNVSGWFIPFVRGVGTPLVVESNVMFTVPKNKDIDRVACKEPDLNLWCQKALGNVIRRRLKKYGIDLNDQGNNQRLAQEASLTGSHATLDLSSASDSLTTALVSRLLPPDWFFTMEALRCRFTDINGELHENQMFSSMGNGFTFELESLIFWALARAVCYCFNIGGRILVYGDDIIVPTAAYKRLTQVLGFCGFLVNPKKSFSTGPFRESCGAHLYYGFDVKPVYIRRMIETTEDLILHLNSLRRWYTTHIEISSLIGVEPNQELITRWYQLASRYIDKRLWGGRYVDRTDSLVTPHKLGSRVLKRSTTHLKKLETRLQEGVYLSVLSEGSPLIELTSSRSLGRPRPILTREGEVVMRKRPYCYWTSVEPRPSW